jgi:hypothetical protein
MGDTDVMPKYETGQLVWLKECGPPEYDEVIPRQKGLVMAADDYGDWTGYVVQVVPEDEHDDGIREVDEDVIEGVAEGDPREFERPISLEVARALSYGKTA